MMKMLNTMLRPSIIMCALVACAAVRVVSIHAHEYFPFNRSRREGNAEQQMEMENENDAEDLNRSGGAINDVRERFGQSQDRVGLTGVLFDPADVTTVENGQSAVVEEPAMHFQVLGLLDKVAPVVAEVQIQFHGESHDDCGVCFGPVDVSSGKIRKTQCGHSFHSGCLEALIQTTSNSCLDWRNYVMSTVEDVKVSVRRPTCPYCVSDLPVLPSHLVQQAIFTSFSNNLPLSNMSHSSYFRGASRMWDVLSAMNSLISREYEPHAA